SEKHSEDDEGMENARSYKHRCGEDDEQPHTPEDKCSTVSYGMFPNESPSATTTTSLYVPFPDSAISEEFIKTENNGHYISYLTGPGIPEWYLNEDSTRWVVRNIDISEICLEYRAVVVKKCESMAVVLSAIEGSWEEPVMDLRFEGIYRMILIGEFGLPRGSTSWGTVLQCYQVMNTIW
ncbi:1381_t:CDS:2, partial [Acaulospora colombiana]